MFIHTVYFWLKPDAPSAATEQLRGDCLRLLSKIPGVKNVWAGAPAMTPRPVVDNSYAIGLTVVLESRAAHDAYQDHPLHQEFVTRNKPNFQRLQVYDFA